MSTLIRLMAGLAIIAMLGCEKEDPDPSNPANSPYLVSIDPANFLPGDSITGNTYFPIAIGRTWNYVGEDEAGKAVTVTERVTDSIRVVMGVQCRVVQASEYEEGELVEDTFDWYGQDRSGNVWYFGEDSREIEGGQVVSTSGSWEAGLDGALPGIIMLAQPLEGLWYRQEYYAGEAEDVGQVLSLNETITVPYGTFNNCLRTLEYNLLEPGIEENKIYAPGVGLLRAIATKGEKGFEDLVSVTP